MYSSQNQNTSERPFQSFDRQDRPSDLTTVKSWFGPSHWTLFTYITSLTGKPLSEKDKALIVENVKVKKLRKRQYFLQEGEVCKYMGFIVRGSVRMYSVNERGHESIASFGLENSWVTDQESFNTANLSVFHIEAMEDTEMLIVSCSQMERMVAQVPVFASMLRAYQIEQLIAAQKRINTALSMTAEERYYDLLHYMPEYARRFSQNMLACYLGLKPETLSRIRKR